MTTDGRPPTTNEPTSVEKDPTDPPLLREASTPEEVDAPEEAENHSGA
jgi:hypothetical protein